MAGQHRRDHPAAVCGADFQPGHGSLAQDGHEGAVGMRRQAVLAAVKVRLVGVIIELHVEERFAKSPVEKILRQQQRLREQRQHLPRQLFEGAVVGEQVFAKARQVGRPLVESAKRLAREHVGVVRGEFAAHAKGRIQVGLGALAEFAVARDAGAGTEIAYLVLVERELVFFMLGQCVKTR